ncbi:uncharacterized protein MYCFIDRAFT_78679 [Pseudocercospora fijiensis CIRAD86]|uniref:Uncharacterized protein n=1 Tax=Pseudocercospora fijiensis (strain CIRAD86) TaxID=383855 RepID=M3AXQ4_PSEFD|nr:uncharacterized protein MYCFIDRAFT_78679 [Pseudocercospora fijiensis CIRAD86]EME81893.1 hypothetical protein MYCFIDRAFT_78679 [Pseudocercospora fijiensis CIRAD86]
MSRARALQNQIATLLRDIWATMSSYDSSTRNVRGSESSLASSPSDVIGRSSDASVTICDSCYESFRLCSKSIIGTNGGYLCDDCSGQQQSSRRRRPRTNNDATADVASRESRDGARPSAVSSQAGQKQYRSTYAGDRIIGSECDSGQYYFSQQSPPSPSPSRLETVATAQTKQRTLFTPYNTADLSHTKSDSSSQARNDSNTLRDIMTPGQTPPAAMSQDAALKRKFPGTPEPTPTKRTKATLEAGFSTPRKALEASSRATPSTAPFTPPTGGQRAIGLFGSQARSLARGNQKSLTFNENDLPPDQALRLYQGVENMIKTLPAMTYEPLIALAKRLDATEKENQKLKADFKNLEKNFESSIQELTVKMNTALGLHTGAENAANGPSFGSSGRDQGHGSPSN